MSETALETFPRPLHDREVFVSLMGKYALFVRDTEGSRFLIELIEELATDDPYERHGRYEAKACPATPPKRLGIYHLTPKPGKLKGEWDIYSDAVVIASDEHAAREIHPAPKFAGDDFSYGGAWVAKPEHVNVRLLGLAEAGAEAGLVTSSYHGA